MAKMDPGGAAWQSNSISEGDLFISLQTTTEKILNEGKSAAEIQDVLENTTDHSVVLTLKKQNGQIKNVKLIKLKIESQDNTIKGYVLKGKPGNIGYISIPGFYMDMFNLNSPGCANDVAKELIKLESDTINGLILDLRNNGGGSMLEAINLAGIFVDEGPLLIYKQRNKKPAIIKDINRGAIFKKPIVVLINEFSASASELFCNIVKDYNLGIVVGQTSYGKGTSQIILPLDTSLYNMNSGIEKATDFLKISSAGFYRLNCTSHQAVGVVPDVVLPATPGNIFYKESREPFYLNAEAIAKNVYYTPNPAYNINLLQQRSADRINHSEDFHIYTRASDSLMAFMSSPHILILKWGDFKKFRQISEDLFLSYEKACKTTQEDIRCNNTSFDRQISEVSEQTREFNLKIRESIARDLFINEAYNILNDLISITK